MWPEFLAGDIILFAGQGDLYAKASRWLMRGHFESPTYAVHTAQFLDPERVLEMDFVGRIRSVSDVLNNKKRYKGDLWRRRGLQVWRCQTLTDRQRHALTRCALTYTNVRFGTIIPWALRGLLLIPALQVVDVAATLLLLRRWRQAPHSHPHGGRSWAYILLPLVPNLLIALLPIPLRHRIGGFLRLFMPDGSWIALISGSFAAIWIFLRTGLVLWSLRKASSPALRMCPGARGGSEFQRYGRTEIDKVG